MMSMCLSVIAPAPAAQAPRVRARSRKLCFFDFLVILTGGQKILSGAVTPLKSPMGWTEGLMTIDAAGWISRVSGRPGQRAGIECAWYRGQTADIEGKRDELWLSIR